MSKFYNAKRTRKNTIYDPSSSEPFKLSRSKVELFMACPKCFYIDIRLGIGRPKGFPFNLNSAVDKLLKKEFDLLRENGEVHPLMKQYSVDAVPAKNDKLNEWRENFKGVQFIHESTNLLLYGAIDDLWENPKGEYIVVDYKATSKNAEIIELNEDWQDGYKRQMEIYQWLIRRNGYKVSDTGYFVYCNGRKDLAKFDGKLEFDITLIAHKGNDNWVEFIIKDIHTCLNSDEVPVKSEDCDYCAYREAVSDLKTF